MCRLAKGLGTALSTVKTKGVEKRLGDSQASSGDKCDDAAHDLLVVFDDTVVHSDRPRDLGTRWPE